MIVVKIREVAERRGITTPYQLAKNLGLKGQSKAARLWEGKTLPTLETLDDICAKWNCDLDALVTFVREPAPKKAKAARKGR